MSAPEPAAAPLGPPTTLARRADFLAAARARWQSRPGMAVQARRRDPAEPAAGIRVGYTCSKKVGNAVARNRAKRRLRAAARAVLPTHGRPGWDYVLIGRTGATATRPFAALCDDLAIALRALHRDPA
jgi:ribonuclease P protein component